MNLRYVPIELEERREISVRFQLYENLKFDGWLSIIRRIRLRNIDIPRTSPRYSFAEFNQLSLELADSAFVLLLWQASCIANTSESSPSSLAPPRTTAQL